MANVVEVCGFAMDVVGDFYASDFFFGGEAAYDFVVYFQSESNVLGVSPCFNGKTVSIIVEVFGVKSIFIVVGGHMIGIGCENECILSFFCQVCDSLEVGMKGLLGFD